MANYYLLFYEFSVGKLGYIRQWTRTTRTGSNKRSDRGVWWNYLIFCDLFDKVRIGLFGIYSSTHLLLSAYNGSVLWFSR